jgi:hypothetical protein
VLYTHNDSGSAARFYALREDGSLIATIDLPDAGAIDWEDMAVGPGPQSGESYVYFADVGDNNAIRPTVAVYRAPEPDLDLDASGDSLEVDAVQFVFEYPDGPRDAETLFVDPESGDLYVVSKSLDGNEAYVAQAPYSDTGVNALEFVSLVDLPMFELATGGDMSADGRLIAIRTHGGLFAWPRGPGETVAEALARRRCRLPAAVELQGEAVAIGADATDYFTVSEGSGAPLYRSGLE